MKERMIALFLMAFSAILFLSALTIPEPRFEPLGAGFLGKTIPALIFLLGLILAILAFRTTAEKGGTQNGALSIGVVWARMGMTLQIFAALCLYIIGLGLGDGFAAYVVTSVVFFMLCAFILTPGVYGRPFELAVTVVAACALCLFIGWGFSEVLHVSLP